MAATANGTRTPPEATMDDKNALGLDSGDRKRKREDISQHRTTIKATTSRNAPVQRDVLEILEQHDTQPSFLHHALEHKNATVERLPKKARLSDSASANDTTISSKLTTGAYASLQALLIDAQHVSEGLTSTIRAKAKDREGQNGRLLVEDLKQIQKAQAFEKFVHQVVDQEMKYDQAREGDFTAKGEPGDLPNGDSKAVVDTAARKNGTVLTLFGNAPTPKQLFSSMQSAPSGTAEQLVKSELPVEEMSLPTGIAATQIMSAAADDAASGPTFEEAFPAPYNLPAFHPPKSHRRSAARDEVVRWEFKDLLAARNKKGGYTVQSLTVGEWLGYGGVDSKDDPSSAREKRKLRDRALSSGEATQPPPSRASLEEAMAKEEEALFRRAYSSFAPSCDNSRALVPEEIKSMVWWQKTGQKRYEETFALDPALASESSRLPAMPDTAEVIRDEDFSKVIEDFEEFEEVLPGRDAVRDKTDVDQVLDYISELLETLASQQRVRNASLQASTSASRTPISPAPLLASRIGRPDSPSEDEVSTYHAIRREIAYLILRVPPYVVAKLNGAQLDELGVSKLITFQSKDRQGTMEEDQVARLAKYTAAATAHGIAALTRPGTGSQHYSSTNQRTPAIGQAANTRYGQSGQYTGNRTPMTQPQYNRPINSQQSYGTPSAAGTRPSYGQPNQYTSQSAQRTSFNQPNGSKVYYGRQISQPHTQSMYGNYPQQYPSSTTPSIQPARPSYTASSSQPLAQFQQRSYSAAQNAVGYQTTSHNTSQSPVSFNRTMSPLKPANHQPPLQPSPMPRVQQQFQPPPPPQQPGSGRATPVQYPSQPQTPVNGISLGQQQQQAVGQGAGPNGHA